MRLGLEALVNQKVRLIGRVGGAGPGRKILTLVAAILVGASHIDHADRLRAGATHRVLPFRVMAPSTLGTFLRAFTFGHVRQLDAVIAERSFWPGRSARGPGTVPMTIDSGLDWCEVFGKAKQGAADADQMLGHHPIVATWAKTGEVAARPTPGGFVTARHRALRRRLVARARRARAPVRRRACRWLGFFSSVLLEPHLVGGLLVDHGHRQFPWIRCLYRGHRRVGPVLTNPRSLRREAQVAEAAYVAGKYGAATTAPCFWWCVGPAWGSGPAGTVAKLAPPRSSLPILDPTETIAVDQFHRYGRHSRARQYATLKEGAGLEHCPFGLVL